MSDMLQAGVVPVNILLDILKVFEQLMHKQTGKDMMSCLLPGS